MPRAGGKADNGVDERRVGGPAAALRKTVSIYEFVDEWEARLARDALDDAGFDAWLEESESAVVEETTRRFRLLVLAEDADEARAALTEPLAELPDYDTEAPTRDARPFWVPAVAAIVVIGLVIGSVDAFLWPWIIITAFVGFLFWRTIGPRRPD
jgi:hypothetical protein